MSSSSSSDASRRQAKDLRDLAALTGQLLNGPGHAGWDVPSAARSFMKECVRDGAAADDLMRHPFLRAAQNATGGGAAGVVITPGKVRRGG
eukprot:CAMPEP_0182479134 /NCGR_PEP_ID=MMETSP1319-20130603/33673_1 /TAXON_ID=172717 /ORGANISM="Bolidomonas pacifica, Strain RCC208" /LENGTH=90 /DNA_ID=CAMNT_0024680541 /DNA_START=174 /DNA_END=442 /DNA_ORIENTATION=+